MIALDKNNLKLTNKNDNSKGNIMGKEVTYGRSTNIEQPFLAKREKTTIKNLLKLCKTPNKKIMYVEQYIGYAKSYDGDLIRPVIDVDIKYDNNKTPTIEEIKNYEEYYLKLLRSIFKDGEINIATNHRVNKISFHYIVSNYKTTCRDLLNMCEEIGDENIDKSIYKGEQKLMRIANQYKLGTEGEPILNNTLDKYILNYIEDEYILYENKNDNIKQIEKRIYGNYRYFYNKDDIIEILNNLPNKYLDNFEEWFKITGILKSEDL
jgi:hypothetical protein